MSREELRWKINVSSKGKGRKANFLYAVKNGEHTVVSNVESFRCVEKRVIKDIVRWKDKDKGRINMNGVAFLEGSEIWVRASDVDRLGNHLYVSVEGYLWKL